jgi:hypothetical protein
MIASRGAATAGRGVSRSTRNGANATCTPETRRSLRDLPEPVLMTNTARQQTRTRRRAQRHRMPLRIRQPAIRQTLHRRHLHPPAVRPPRRHPRVVVQHHQHVRRPLRRLIRQEPSPTQSILPRDPKKRPARAHGARKPGATNAAGVHLVGQRQSCRLDLASVAWTQLAPVCTGRVRRLCLRLRRRRSARAVGRSAALARSVQ